MKRRNKAYFAAKSKLKENILKYPNIYNDEKDNKVIMNGYFRMYKINGVNFGKPKDKL